MSVTERLAGIGEVLGKIRGDAIPDYKTWHGSEEERARNAEAEEYLASIGIDSRGLRYSTIDVLIAKRQETTCAGCNPEAVDISGCPTRGYKTLLRQDNVWVRSISAPCKIKAAIERQETVELLIGALPAKLRTKSFENFRPDGASESVSEAFSKTMKSAETG